MRNRFDQKTVVVFRRKSRGVWKTFTAHVPEFALRRFVAKIRDGGGKILSA